MKGIKVKYGVKKNFNLIFFMNLRIVNVQSNRGAVEIKTVTNPPTSREFTFDAVYDSKYIHSKLLFMFSKIF